MRGFFKKEEVTSLKQSSAGVRSCYSCGLYKCANSPKIKPWGNFDKEILIIGDYPGARDDKKGKPWQGDSGRLLDNTLHSLGIDLFQDCLSINAVNCRPKDDVLPTDKEVMYCRDIKVLKVVVKYKPQVIILLGTIVVNSLIGHRWRRKIGSISKWRGWTIPDQDYKAWICPTFHPSYVEQVTKREVINIWKNDLKKAISCVSMRLPKFKKPKIHYLENLKLLSNIPNGAFTAFDYECTGLKPHQKGHKIVCAAIAYDDTNVYTFMMPEKKKKCALFIEYLQNYRIDKVAANLKYEDNWSNVILGTDVKGWVWDTMLAAHGLDNRSGVTGLKFQVYVMLGVVDYDSEVGPYLKSKTKGANSMNRLLEFTKTAEGRKAVLKYCAWDSYCERKIAIQQRELINYNDLPF